MARVIGFVRSTRIVSYTDDFGKAQSVGIVSLTTPEGIRHARVTQGRHMVTVFDARHTGDPVWITVLDGENGLPNLETV